jgi:hypothetical protein
VKQDFDVYLIFDDSDECRAQLDDLESREWDVGEELLPTGLRRISKPHSNEDALQADLERTLGPLAQVEYLTTSDRGVDEIVKIGQLAGGQASDRSRSRIVAIRRESVGTDAGDSDDADSTSTPSGTARNGTKPQPTESTTPELTDEVAQVVHEGALLLNSPAHLWEYIGAGDERKELALRVGEHLFRERASVARAVSYSVSPESELLRRAAGNDQLAKKMLEVRAGLTEQDTALRRLDVEARKQEVALQRALISTIPTLQEQVKKWTWLAGWAPYFLIATVLFAMAMTAWLVEVAAGKLDGWALAPTIFALALFAVSPVVLLLLERPLEGIDKWMPSAGSGTADTGSSGSGDSASSARGDAVTETTTSQTTTSRAGPRIGGHKGERPN